MKKRSVLAVILVLLCFCLSFANGEKSIKRARESARRRYGNLIHSLTDPNVLPPASTIHQHIRDVEDRAETFNAWIQETSGYSHEQLSSPPKSFMNEDVLKLATEYHQLKTGWYHVRLISLNTATERENEMEDMYPSTYKCRDFALKAYRLLKYHNQKYQQCYNALSQTAQVDIMEVIEFPNYIVPRELDHEYPANKNCLDFKWHKNQYAGSNDILQVKTHLDHLIKCLTRRKESMNPGKVKSSNVIEYLMAPSGMLLNKSMMRKLTKCFSVEDLSQPPNKGFRSYRQFLEVAWLFNHYRSIFHEIRYNEFRYFLRYGEPGPRPETMQRARKAIKVEKKSYEGFELLCNEYHEALNVVTPNEFCEEKHWSGKRKRTTLKRVGRKYSHETDQTVEHQSSNETLEKGRSDLPVLNELHASDNVATVVNGQTEKGQVYQAKCTCLPQTEIGLTDDDVAMAYILYNEALKSRLPQPSTTNDRTSLEPGGITKVEGQIHISEDAQKQWSGKRKRTTLRRGGKTISQGTDETVQNRSLDDKERSDSPMLYKPDTSEVNGQTEEVHRAKRYLFFEELYLPTGIHQVERGKKMEVEDFRSVDAHSELHTNVVLCANKYNQDLYDAFEMDSIAPKR